MVVVNTYQVGFGLRIEIGGREDHHQRYLRHNPASTRHWYSSESVVVLLLFVVCCLSHIIN